MTSVSTLFALWNLLIPLEASLTYFGYSYLHPRETTFEQKSSIFASTQQLRLAVFFRPISCQIISVEFNFRVLYAHLLGY